MKTLVGLSALALVFGLVAAPDAMAQWPIPERTTWSIGEPTLVGDMVLQPGTYRIETVARPQDRNVIKISSEDGRKHFTTVLTVPHPLQPGEERPSAMFVYWPAVGDAPRALRTWFPAEPMSGGGHDIVYQEDRARMLARAAETRVVSYPETTQVTQLESTELRYVTPDDRIEVWTAPPRTMTTTTTTTTRIVEDRTVAGAREELPATGSRTPLVALLGLLAIAGAFVLRAVR